MSDDLLQVWDADGAFERIEAWLVERGFFAPGGEELEADLYLGYALSQSIRRGTSSLPPEPCRALPLAACRVRLSREDVRRQRAGLTRRRRLGAVVDGCRVLCGRRRGARGDRPRRRLSGEPRAAPPGPVRGRPARARRPPRATRAPSSRDVRRRRLDGRVRLARALPLSPRRPDPDDAHQGNAAPRCRRRAPRVREGRRRARDDRRPRAERSLARLRGGQRALARAHGDPRARRRGAHGLDRGGNAARRSRSRRDPCARPSPADP